MSDVDILTIFGGNESGPYLQLRGSAVSGQTGTAILGTAGTGSRLRLRHNNVTKIDILSNRIDIIEEVDLKGNTVSNGILGIGITYQGNVIETNYLSPNGAYLTNIPYAGLSFTDWTGTFDGEEGTAYHDAANLTGNVIGPRLTNAFDGAWDGADDWIGTVSGTAAATIESGAAAGATALQPADTNTLAAIAYVDSATGGCVQVDGTGLTGSLAFTNETTTACGIYNGTNGVFWTKNETNYWLLFAL